MIKKPGDPSEIVPYLQSKELKNRLSDPYLNELTLRRDIHHTLDTLKIPRYRKGYQYLSDAIKICMLDRNAIFELRSKIIDRIAQMRHYTPKTINSELCDTLDQAYQENGIAHFCKYLKLKVDPQKGKPTLAQVVASITEKVRFKY